MVGREPFFWPAARLQTLQNLVVIVSRNRFLGLGLDVILTVSCILGTSIKNLNFPDLFSGTWLYTNMEILAHDTEPPIPLFICPPQRLNIISSQHQKGETAGNSAQCPKHGREARKRKSFINSVGCREICEHEAVERKQKSCGNAVVSKLKGTFELIQFNPFPETWGNGAQRGALGAFLLPSTRTECWPRPILQETQGCGDGRHSCYGVKIKPKLGRFCFCSCFALFCFSAKSLPPSLPDMNQYWLSDDFCFMSVLVGFGDH